MAELLEIKNLSVSFQTQAGEVQALRDVSISLRAGEVLAIVGESGCGKSVLCKSVLKLLPPSANIRSGSICVSGTDITRYRDRQMRRLRGNVISMVFQDPMTVLHPSVPVGKQIAEALKVHRPAMTKSQLQERTVQLMQLTGIGHAWERMRQYPCQLSGGMRQRVVLAAALACDPELLLADEPTTALDAVVEAQILKLLGGLQKKLGMAVVFVTHDLGAAAKIADRVAVMYAGKIVETGTAGEIFHNPGHPYTQALLQALPSCSGKKDFLPRMQTEVKHPELEEELRKEPEQPKQEMRMKPGYPERETRMKTGYPERETRTEPGYPEPEILLDIRHLSCQFPLTKKMVVTAIEDLSFQICKGEIFGLVGESGCGKSTTARCIMNICRPDNGSIFYKGIDICNAKKAVENRRLLQTGRQLIFQDSASSLDPRMKVCDLITEPLKIWGIRPERGSLRAEAQFQMREAGLDAEYLERYPSELSGGQRQRVAIARALIMKPELLIADEPFASLDVLIQAQIASLFLRLKKERGFTFLLIAHDLNMVRLLCDRVGVMYRGKLAECAPVSELFANPRHPYTKMLLEAV